MDVIIYTDGACLGNPGQGGYAAILEDDKTQMVRLDSKEENHLRFLLMLLKRH